MANLDAIHDIDHRIQAFENHERGILVCLAGPGTGKTFSLLARSEALAGQDYDQESICYLTFIREIASAFSDDYRERFGEEAYAASVPRISTLHSFACRLIRNQGFQLGYDGELFFMNFADSDEAAKTFLGDLLPFVSRDGCRTVSQLRSVVEEIKSDWQDSVDPATSPESASVIMPQMVAISSCFRLLDWDQTIPLAHELFLRLDPIPDWLAKIKHYFVDEYQDFNRAEQELISRLEGIADSMVIVGDDDQSLYSRRGGAPDGIRQLFAAPEHDQVTLVKCYRCKSNIVTPTNTFQAHLGGTARPMTAASAGGQVACYRFKSSKAEVAFLSEYLNTRLAELPEVSKPKDGIACLFPSKRILNAYFEMLRPTVECSKRDRDVPEERVWLDRVLSILVRRKQRFLERLLLNAYPAVKPRHRSLIVGRVVEHNVSPAEACISLIAENAFTGAAASAVHAFVEFCASLAERNLRILSQRISAELSLDQQAILNQLERLIESDAYEQSGLISPICDELLPDTAVPEPDPRVVAFLTMHGSKGLTRKTVVLPGLEEACIPDGGDPAGLPEKRRLFFVALSRATDNLLLTLPHNRGGGADSLNFPMPGRGVPSSFIGLSGLAAQYHQ